MSLTRRGQTGWFFSSSGQLQTDRFGLAQASGRWTRTDIPTTTNPGSPIAFGSLHPVWPWMTCDRFTIGVEEGVWVCDGQFFGVQGTPEPVYEFDRSTAQEAIETHNDFEEFAGTPSAPQSGAQFDAEGGFIGFTSPSFPLFRGVTDYLSPGAVWRKNYVTTVRPADVSTVGKVDVPEGTPPAVPAGRNWLYMGLTWEQRGRVYTVRKEWLLSGRLGWNPFIYT